MLGINSNINSLVAQQNLNTSQSALSQAITRLSSGKRINSAADDAAGLAISNRMQTQINGLNQGVSNANDGVSMIQTASSGLAQITSSLQTIRPLAVQASSGSLSSSDQAALQQEVAQQIAEVNRVASQTTYNGKNVLDGSAGNVSFQVGANVGQTISLNLTQSLSAASMGRRLVPRARRSARLTGLSLDATRRSDRRRSTPAITSINVLVGRSRRLHVHRPEQPGTFRHRIGGIVRRSQYDHRQRHGIVPERFGDGCIGHHHELPRLLPRQPQRRPLRLSTPPTPAMAPVLPDARQPGRLSAPSPGLASTTPAVSSLQAKAAQSSRRSM